MTASQPAGQLAWPRPGRWAAPAGSLHSRPPSLSLPLSLLLIVKRRSINPDPASIVLDCSFGFWEPVLDFGVEFWILRSPVLDFRGGVLDFRVEFLILG